MSKPLLLRGPPFDHVQDLGGYGRDYGVTCTVLRHTICSLSFSICSSVRAVYCIPQGTGWGICVVQQQGSKCRRDDREKRKRVHQGRNMCGDEMSFAQRVQIHKRFQRERPPQSCGQGSLTGLRAKTKQQSFL